MRHQHPSKNKICLNCGNHFKGNFCPSCGQKAEVERLTASHLISEVLHYVTHYEKGFVHTIWSFLVRPGIAGLNFLNGKRKEYQTPISYILILTGVYILIHNFIIDRFGYHYLSAEPITATEQSNIFFRTHFTPFILVVLIASAYIIHLVLAGKKYNFIEILTVCLFGGGTYFLMLLFSDIVLGSILKINIISVNVIIWQTALSAVYNFWFCYDFFKRLPMRFFWPRMIATALLISITGWGIMSYLPMAWINLFG